MEIPFIHRWMNHDLPMTRGRKYICIWKGETDDSKVFPLPAEIRGKGEFKEDEKETRSLK